MEETVSVSRGVFAFKKPKGKKHRNATPLSSSDYWGEGLEERIQDLTYRHFTRCWKIASGVLQDLQEEIHNKVFHGLIVYIHVSGQRLTTSAASGFPAGLHENLRSVPTACLVTGVNMPDRDITFDCLSNLLRASVTPYIARLQSKECTTVRATIIKMISQLVAQNHVMGSLLEEEEEEGDELMVGLKLKRNQCTMSVLTSWYKEQTKTGEEDQEESHSSKYRNSPKRRPASPSKASQSPSRRTPSSPSKRMPISPSKLTRSPSRLTRSPSKLTRSPSKLTRSPSKLTRSPSEKIPNSPRKRTYPTSLSKINISPTKKMFPNSPTKAEQHLQEDEGSPRKRLKSSLLSGVLERSSKPPLVVILEDVESFPPRILNDLILICSEHRWSVPIVLVFGVATTPDAVHQILSQDAAACVAMEVFRAEPSSHYLSRVIEKVVLNPKIPFHLGGRPFKLLLDIFLYNDLSVENFVKGLKVCMLEHFQGHTSSFLCCSAITRTAVLKNTTAKELDIIRQLPSYRTYVEGSPAKEQVALLVDEKYTKKAVLSLLDSLDVWYARFSCLVKVANALTSRLPRAPMGRQVREVLAICLSQPLVESEEFVEATKSIGVMDRQELLCILQNVCAVLQEHCDEDEVVSELLDEVNQLVVQLSTLDQQGQGKEPSAGGTAVTLGPTDRFHLREKLLEIAKKPKKSNAYDSLRSSVLQLFTNTFKMYLHPPTSQPLHEILFFYSSQAAKRLLVGLPRPAISTALANPHHYLQCECCYLEDPSNLVTSLPDLSIAYKLHLECGRHINLYDWLQAFISVVGREEEEEEEERIGKSSRMVHKEFQARFVRAISELQFLGFIKHTKRKTDHVARLTWGGC